MRDSKITKQCYICAKRAYDKGQNALYKMGLESWKNHLELTKLAKDDTQENRQ